MTQSSKLCIVITGPSLEEALQQTAQASSLADIVEFRLDLFQFSQLNHLTQLRQSSSLPVIFTLRRVKDGGKYSESEEKRIAVIKKLLPLTPDYLDLECDVSSVFFDEMTNAAPNIQIICSLHDFNASCKDLESIFQKMQKRSANLYKIVTSAKNPLDALHMLAFIKKTALKGECLAGMCVGEHGQLTRVLGPICGSALTYAALDDASRTMTGQLSAQTLLQTYHYRKLNASTRLYGLIGDPVEQSPSHDTHNAAIRQLDLNAVYVKVKTADCDLAETLTLLRKLGFCGLSVTMPLKETILKHCTAQNQAIGAVNTLLFESESGDVIGCNTDGSGALEAIQQKIDVRGKKIILLGAGGVAQAIAYELHHHKAELVILNRCPLKAERLAIRYGGVGGHLENFSFFAQQGYDLLINCTPVGMSSNQNAPIDTEYLVPDRLVMETIIHPRETFLVAEAKKRGCPIIYGYELFHHQAARQFSVWFN